jgi:lipopolysaccharide export system permease protein
VRTLDRYVLREVALSWLAVTGVLGAILVSNQLAQVLGQAAERGYPRAVILRLIGLMSIQNGTLLIPIGLLLGIALALGRLYHDSEMAALRACGVGPGAVLRPIAVLAAGVTVAVAWLVLDTAPRAFARAQDIQKEALRSAEFGMLEPGKFHSFSRGRAVLYAESADPDGTLRRVFLQRRDGIHVEIVLADRARHLVSEDGDVHTLVLYDGERFEGSPGLAEMRRVRFAEHGIPVRVAAQAGGPVRVEGRPTGDLLADGGRPARAEFEWRLSLPLMVVVLTLLAVPLSELQPRQGRYARIGVVLLVFFIYSNLLSAARTWFEKGTVPEFLGLWWPHLLVLAVAAVLWWRRAPPRWAVR